jgi:hypothetical protein
VILLKDIVEALDAAGDEVSSYVNRATGEVRTVTDEELRYAEDDEDASGLPEWQRESVAQARDVLDSDDWLPLPSKFDIDEWEIMDDFARSLPDGAHSAEVIDAIHGSGAFRRFKAAIRRLGIEESWFAHRAQALERIACSWLRAHGLEYR